jgi:hypothetical protein
MAKILSTTLTRVSKTTLQDIKRLQEDYGFRNSREVIDTAIKTLAAAYASQVIDSVAGKGGIVHAKRKRR